MTNEQKPRRPIIGFVGLVLLVLGIITAYGSEGALWPFTLIIVGAAILLVALFTGNIKMFG